MTTRFLSLATAIVTLDVYLQSRLSSTDPLFYFTSNNLAVNTAFILLAALMVSVSFRPKFKTWYGYAGCAAAGLFLCTLGTIGILFSDVDNFLSNILLPLNYLIILEAGVVLGLCALTYQHEPAPAKIRAYDFVHLMNRFAFLAPKIPHSPTPVSPRRPRTV
jgi:hypothetical protein